MMFAVPLMCWECRYTLLLTRVHPNHCYTVSWISYLTGSNEALYIHPRELELSMKARMCDPGPNCWMLRYIDVANIRNYSKLSMKPPHNSGGTYQNHVRTLLL